MTSMKALYAAVAVALAATYQCFPQDPTAATLTRDLLIQARTKAQAGLFTEAEATITRAITTSPNDAQSHCDLGVLQFNRGNYDAAIQSLTRAIALNRNLATAHAYLGLAAREKGWSEAAEKELVIASDIVKVERSASATLASSGSQPAESQIVDGSITGDMQEYLNETERLAKAGKYEEALKRHLWFHDHALEYDDGIAAVRLSFALSDWEELGRKYPPALQAMVSKRDETVTLVKAGQRVRKLFPDIVALNESLGQNSQTVTLFETLAKDHPQLGRELWTYAQEVILKAERFDLAKKYGR
jgi:tetratricopeptide (TPR) repeat protein